MAGAKKIALVTGGARRIGRAIVSDLAANGYAIALHCKGSRAEADRLCGEIVTGGGNAIVISADLTENGVAEDMIGRCHAELGGLGIVVNNASLFENDSATDFDWDTWDRHFALHLKAPVALARAFAGRLGEDEEGLVVNIIDQRVWRLTPRFFSYTLSKSALWTATQTLAQALSPRIRVNAIGPGPTLPNERQSESDFRSQTEALLLGRGADLSEFGAAIRFLHGARSVTGQMIALDGGQHLAWETPDIAGIRE
jgi:NAD(P)-dependent dehydrogenase (short-subunit alcohol dehydrogenase family)